MGNEISCSEIENSSGSEASFSSSETGYYSGKKSIVGYLFRFKCSSSDEINYSEKNKWLLGIN